jgi:hypothetical protein
MVSNKAHHETDGDTMSAIHTADAINRHFSHDFSAADCAKVIELAGDDCVVVDDGAFVWLVDADAAEDIEALGAAIDAEDDDAARRAARDEGWETIALTLAANPTDAQAAAYWSEHGTFLQLSDGSFALEGVEFRAAQVVAQMMVDAGKGDEDVDLDHVALSLHIDDSECDVTDTQADALDREPTWAELARCDGDSGRLSIDGVACHIAEW